MNITIILQILGAVAQLIPEIAAVIPIVEKIIKGETVTVAEAATVYTAMGVVETMVAAREQAALKG